MGQPPGAMTLPKSRVFDATVGCSVPAGSFSKDDYLIDPSRFASEGNWAFCRFTSEDVPAARLGFQRGGFNGGSTDLTPSPQYLQLHLELMTREGAILWLPSGIYPAGSVRTDPHAMNIELEHRGRKIFSFRGWPKIECHFCSEDGAAQADLQFDLAAVTVLPDCILPYCLFGMWECMGEVSGSVRSGDRTIAVAGKVFFDHTRVIAARHPVVARQMYVYTTLYFEDGSGLFGYHAVDVQGRPIEDYCFGVYLEPTGKSHLLKDATLTHLALDADRIASGWQICWRTTKFSVSAEIWVERSRILKCWGTPDAPQERSRFSIIPLVLNARGEIADGGIRRKLLGRGLAEYFNADLWPADAAAAAIEIDS
jgi:hypothetical protein